MSTKAPSLTDVVTTVGTGLVALAGLAYGAGYMALRARGRALGIEPSIELSHEAYVFAGFQFLRTVVVSALFAVPAAFGLFVAARRSRRAIPLALRLPAELAAAAVFSAVVILAIYKIDVRDAVRVATVTSPPPLTYATLGEGGLGSFIFLASIAFSALSGLWLGRLWTARRRSMLTVWVAGVLLLQLMMLPVWYGMFLGDRHVAVLDRAPKSAGLVGLVAVVDRHGDRVVLLGVNKRGERCFVSTDDTRHVGVDRTSRLYAFLTELTKQQPYVLSYESFVDRLLHELHQLLETSSTRHVAQSRLKGVVWSATIDGARASPGQPVASAQNLSWPVVGTDRTAFAIRGRRVVRLEPHGRARPVAGQGGSARWVKLLGVCDDGAVLGFVYDRSSPSHARAAMLTPDGSVVLGPAARTPADIRQQEDLLSESRAYDGGRRLVVRRSDNGHDRGRGFDVYVESAAYGSVNVSGCGDDTCGQPSLAGDGSAVVWVRAAAD